MKLSLTNGEIVVYPRWSKEIITHKVETMEGGHGGADPMLLDAFVEAVKNGDTSICNAEQGILPNHLIMI